MSCRLRWRRYRDRNPPPPSPTVAHATLASGFARIAVISAIRERLYWTSAIVATAARVTTRDLSRITLHRSPYDEVRAAFWVSRGTYRP